MDFSRICRICLAHNKQTYLDIFTNYYTKRNTLYSEMIANCTKLKPCLEDGLPKHICKDCCRHLKRTYVFNIQCEESDKKLKDYLENDLKVKIIGCHAEDKYNKQDNVVEDVKGIGSIICKHQDSPEHDILVSILDEGLESSIKLEPPSFDDGNNSTWDADDDNIVLGEIKLKKELEGIPGSKIKEEKEKPKMKRGRKKRVFAGIERRPVPESKLPHQCDVCGKLLSTKSNLKAHKICHTDLRPYRCSECPAAFRGHSALFQHKKVHSGETPYHCEYCPKQFSRRTGLVNHIRMHTGEKLYGCELCFKTFVQSAQLSIHMKRHKGEKPYLCQDCGKGFPIKSDLKVHQRIHNGEKPYSCHICAKTFATSGNLSIHIRIHNKEIRYTCKECLRGFVTCSAYNVHVKRHKGQRDHRCECGKAFYTSSALKQHKVVHTGEKKYQCKICDRKFTQTSHLSRHFKRDHAKPNAPVPSSDHYKLVLQDNGNKHVFQPLDIQKVPSVHTAVKSEGTQ